ncbi:MBL fold metallo-hydrolase [Nonomuraea maheshkhaliensis]|uniref:MBL fold metallo-hydrolase n=1 Tax=Nonomuraea maheshkhaliensis TaxID=419590 RepID=A0ABP4RLQ0_9ACTN
MSVRPEEIARQVYRLETGHGLTEANVYLVGSRSGWVLIDTAWAGRAPDIQAAAASLFGPGSRPEAILLTHIHPDHSGAAPALAAAWHVFVHVHPEELRFAPGRYLPEYAHPLDRRVIAPLLRLVPRRRLEAMRAGNSLEGAVVGYEPDEGVPGLTGWTCVPTPGHTPGHVAFLRSADGVLISGDAVVTVELNSPRGFLRPRLSGPPRYTTWDWDRARRSVEELVEWQPRLLAPGHGRPASALGGRGLRDLARRMRRLSLTRGPR